MSTERITDKSLKFDWFFIGVTLTLMTFGVFLVYSATVGEELAVYDTHWFRQIIYFLTGIAIAVGLVFVKIDWLKRAAVPSYAIALILLVFVLIFAGDVKGAGRWIDLKVIKLQPSEFAKIAYLITISYWLSKHPVSLHKLKSFWCR